MITFKTSARLQGEISFQAQSSFNINGQGFRFTKILPKEAFSIHNDFGELYILQDDKPLFRVDSRKTVLASCEYVEGKPITRLSVF